jgi:hypothetical protein
MPASLEDRTLDFGLNVLDTETSFISITSSEPTTIAIAATSGLLGFKNWGVGAAFGSPAAGSPNGRKVSSVAITDGTITTTGTANWWAAYAAGTLHAHGTLAAAQAVTAGNTFSLSSFDIRIPNQ